MQSQQNKPITEHIHSTKKKKKWNLKVCFEIMSNEIEDVFQYLWCEQNKVCFEVMSNETEDMFQYLWCEHFLGYSLLHDFSAVQRLEAAV